MKFSEFILESNSNYKTSITLDEAIKLYRNNCSNTDFDKPYWRGSRDEGAAYLIDGTKGGRKSTDTTNFYNILMDHFASPAQPLRGKSIICTNNAGKTYAKRWADSAMGDLFAVFPYNNAKIGHVGKNDIWDITLTINKSKKSLESWNRLYSNVKADDSSFDAFVKSVKPIFEMNADDMNNDQHEFYYTFGKSVEKMVELLKTAYGPDGMKYKVGDSASLGDVHTNKASEVWIGGPCILINYNTWIDIKDRY